MLIADPLFYIMAVPAMLITGVSKGGFGGGLGVLAVPMMSLAVAPPQAAAIILPILCVMDIFSVWSYRGKWDAKNLWYALPAALIGVLLGTFFFRYLSEDHVRLMVGLIAVLFTLNYFFRPFSTKKQEAHPVRGSFWGVIAGFTSFGVHAGGPPMNIYLLPQQLDKSVFVATTVFFFTVLNYVKLVPYAWLGQFDASNLLTSAILLPLAPAGVLLGVKLHDKIREDIFYKIAYVLLFVTGCKLLYDAVTGLVA